MIPEMVVIKNDLSKKDRSSLLFENNTIKPLGVQRELSGH